VAINDSRNANAPPAAGHGSHAMKRLTSNPAFS
jgi:hypothetical protein